MKKLLIVLAIIIVAFLLILLGGPFFILKEGQQAVVVRFGRIVQEYTNSGLKIKSPFVDRVKRYSKRIQSWDGEAQRLPTEENQFIWVDTTARWMISDPKKTKLPIIG